MRYELTIEILDKDYIDQLVTALVRQGLTVYLNSDDEVCFEVSDMDLEEIKA